MLVHATCLSIGSSGVLLMGKPGSGKSDLALRLIDAPGRGTGENILDAKLVSDDQVLLAREEHWLVAQAPDALTGLIEIRGLGVVPVPTAMQVKVDLVVDLVLTSEVERMPDRKASSREFLGVPVPLISLHPFTASAPARLRAAVITL